MARAPRRPRAGPEVPGRLPVAGSRASPLPPKNTAFRPGPAAGPGLTVPETREPSPKLTIPEQFRNQTPTRPVYTLPKRGRREPPCPAGRRPGGHRPSDRPGRLRVPLPRRRLREQKENCGKKRFPGFFSGKALFNISQTQPKQEDGGSIITSSAEQIDRKRGIFTA